MNTPSAVDNMYYNVYFDDGHYWIKLEATDYHDLLTRPLSKERLMDPVSSFSAAEIKMELMDIFDRLEQSDRLQEYLRSELTEEAFQMWLEFS